VVLVLFLGLGGYLPMGQHAGYAVRTVAVTVVLLAVSRSLVTFRASRPCSSLLVGVAVFVLWIGPDLLCPGYRELWLFRNPLTGAPTSALPPVLRDSFFWLFFRVAGSVLLVPIVEELFWRAWLMRRLISADFLGLPLGAYAPRAFWITAVLFASEHGPYWDVGLLAGIVYNWWLVRTRNLADCILAHAVTNGCLAAYVLLAGAWQYWL
jgi:CAAX prenyl protease-like protein